MDVMPFLPVLRALGAHLKAGILALPLEERFTVRHARNREAHGEEWPCVSIFFVSDDVSGLFNGADDGLSEAESVRELLVDLVAEAILPPEVDEGEAEPADYDPTGLAAPSAMIRACLDTIFVPGEQPSDLGGVAWQIRDEGTGDNSESTTEAARMVERLVILYRVREEAPTHLLTGN